MPAKDSGTLKAIIESQKDKLAMVLPKHLTPDRLMRVVLVAVSKSRELQECSIGSILQCVMTGAQLGLDCSGVLGSAYMVPFFNSKTNQKEAQFIPGYRGLIDLARRSGEIEDIYAHCVYRDDAFHLELGAKTELRHTPNLEVPRLDENIVGAYMVAYLKGSDRPHIEFVPRQDIDKVRASSKAGKFGPWKDWFAEMCRKTAVRRGIKYLPMSVELAEAAQLDDTQFDRTPVIAASTRNAGLESQLTSRPVSEGQILEPAEDAGEQLDAQQADDVPAEEPAPESPEQQVARQEVADALSQDWDAARRVLIDAGAKVTKSAVAAKGIDAWTKLHAPKANGDLLPVERRRELYDAITEGRFDFGTGAIVAAG